jgi:preprotein translocase subunit SecD
VRGLGIYPDLRLSPRAGPGRGYRPERIGMARGITVGVNRTVSWACTLTAVAFVASAALSSPAVATVAGPASGSHAVITMWRGTDTKCPKHLSHSAHRGAVVKDEHNGGGCVRLQRHLLTVDHVKSAHAVLPQGAGAHEWQVDIVLNTHDKREFGRATKATVGHQLAILVNGRLITAPSVNEEIPTGEFQLTGLSEARARQLARELMHSH